MPDPGADGRPRSRSAATAASRRRSSRRRPKACEQYREDIRPELSEEQQAEFKEQALEHARCMREHGIDFPDPTFSADGGAQIRLERGRRLDPEDPEFKAAAGGVRRRASAAAGVGAVRRRIASAAACSPPPRSPAASPCSAATTTRAPRPPRAPPVGATATVERRDLVDRDELDGTLGYAGRRHARRGRGGHDHRAARAGRGRAARRGALRGRRRAGRVPALRRAAGLARLHAVDGGRRRHPPARAQPARARPRPDGDIDGRRRVGLGDDRRGRALPGGARAGRRTARSRAARSCSGAGATRIGEAQGHRRRRRPRRGASWPTCPRPRGASPSTSRRRASSSRARATP